MFEFCQECFVLIFLILFFCFNVILLFYIPLLSFYFPLVSFCL
ncbi:hypothetical protein AVP43_00658 [Geobacillus stearothermophilus]|jgi:hypothetical protein|nr:hypothetical protein AVP43_00658 [Geobacillus stearothermophilus]